MFFISLPISRLEPYPLTAWSVPNSIELIFPGSGEMDKNFDQKQTATKTSSRFWWIKWCFGIYTDSVIERLLNKK